MADAGRIQPQQKAADAGALDCGENEQQRSLPDDHASLNLPNSQDLEIDANLLEDEALKVEPDQAILRLSRALARQAAREDHARECADRARANETRCDLRPLLDRSSG